LAATVGAVLTSFALASPAYAADVEVRIGNFPSGLTAGGQPRSFDGTTTNKDKQPLSNVRHVIVVRLNGIQPDHVKIAKGAFGGQQLQLEATGNGEVRAVDGEAVNLGAEGQRDSVHRTRYWIAFMSDAPSGRADLTFGAFQANGNLLDTASRDFTVKGVSGQPTKTTNQPPTSAPATGPGVIQTFPAGPSYSLAPLQEGQGLTDEGSGVPVVFYVMGAILVAAGGGILWLLFRPRTPLADGAYPTGDYQPVNPAFPVNPPMSRPPNLHPTAVMPTVRDPLGMPQPGVDPWATRGGGATKDSTRDLGPFGHRR